MRRLRNQLETQEASNFLGFVKMQKLLALGEILEERLCCCVVDTAPDEKRRTLLDMKETREAFFGLHIHNFVPILSEGKLKMCLY